MNDRLTSVQFFALLRVQMAVLGQSYTNLGSAIKRRENGGKRILGKFGIVLLFALLFVSVGAMFVSVFASIAEAFHLMGYDWLYMTIAMLMSASLMLVGTVFLAKHQLFEAKDNDLLLAMPIPSAVILAARMASLYVMNLLWGAAVLVPAAGCYFWYGGFSAAVLVRMLAVFLMTALFALALSDVLGWLLSLLTARIRNKSMVTVAASLLFIGVYYYVCGEGMTRLLDLLINQSALVAETLGAVLPLYHIGAAVADGAVVSVLWAVGVLILPFVLVCAVLSATFLRTATASGDVRVRRRDVKAHAYRVRGVGAALLYRENMRLLSSAMYLLNAGIGAVFLAGAAVFALIRYEMLSEMLVLFGVDMVGAVFCGVIGAMLAMILFTPPSVSLDAKTMWILRAMPIASEEILFAKWRLHILWCAVPTAMMSIVGCVFLLRFDASAVLADHTMSQLLDGVRLTMSGAETALSVLCLLLLPQILSVLLGGVGLLIGLRFPMLHWTNETQVVKQSMAVLVALVVNLAVVGIPARR